LLEGRAGADVLAGGSGKDTLVGGAGNDVLVGGTDHTVPDAESDVFVWHLADQGTAAVPAADQIKDFTFGVGGDVLDLRDLIQGEASGTDLAAAQSLDAYLHFTEVNGQAVLQVDPDGGSFSPTETITFSNMSLAQVGASLGLAGGSSDLQIIQQMLEQGNLKNSA
jgi:Ca2+-binding RTX toxin-like protein